MDTGAVEPTAATPRSIKFLNYCKGTGLALTALAAFGATGLSIWLAVRRAPEPVAKASHVATDKTIKQLSSDIQKIYDELGHTQKRCTWKVKALENKMSSYLGGFAAGLSSRPATTASRRQETAVRERILERIMDKPDDPQPQQPASGSKRPPTRKLPSMKQLEQKAAE